MDPAIDIALRAALGLLFAAAALHKLRDLGGFRTTVREYRLVPAPLAGAAAAAIVAAEIVVAAALVWPATRTAGFAGAALLAATYAVAIGVNLRRGRRDLDCGCLGAAGRETLSWWLVARNVAVAAIAVASTGPPLARPLGWVDAVTAIGLFGFAALCWIAADGLVANLPAVERARA